MSWATNPSRSSTYTSTPEWKRLRRRVLKRDGYQCRLRYPGCITTATHVDHTIPIAQCLADPYDDDTCAAACAPCHRVKTAREALAGRKSKKRPPPAHPADLL